MQRSDGDGSELIIYSPQFLKWQSSQALSYNRKRTSTSRALYWARLFEIRPSEMHTSHAQVINQELLAAKESKKKQSHNR